LAPGNIGIIAQITFTITFRSSGSSDPFVIHKRAPLVVGLFDYDFRLPLPVLEILRFELLVGAVPLGRVYQSRNFRCEVALHAERRVRTVDDEFVGVVEFGTQTGGFVAEERRFGGGALVALDGRVSA
jgi:hypothetical protein